ncbi:triple tyrosine motif-containing protein [Bacillus sp. OTU2372]|uniref:triple tyrosine motif-containing protein n=1 Tax=Bacillus sp. OTU2372 TaxID=3043858 RepID=UPI00313EC63D
MKKKPRRVFISLLVLSILISLALPQKFLAEVDTAPPTLEKVELTKTEISAGESNTIYITPKDEISGIKYVSFRAESPSGKHAYGANIWSVDSQGRWYGTIPINEYSEGGTWKIDSISLTDNAGNTKYFYYGKDYTADFIVDSPNADITAPILEKVELSKTDMSAGESNTIYITPKDEISGIKYVSFRAESPSGKHAYGANIWNIDGQGRWYGSIPIDNNSESGLWKIDSISLTDNAGNTKYYYYGTDYTADFFVNSLNVDLKPPTLEKVELGKTALFAGENNLIYITPMDEISGVKYVSFRAVSPSGSQAYGANIWNIDGQGRWYGSIPINANSEIGKWKIESISLTDNAGNTKYYTYGRDYTADFVVKSINTKVNTVNLTVSLPSSQKAGTPIILKATSKGSDMPEYRFFLRDEKGNLTTLQEYGSPDTYTWTPTKAGTYTIIVHAKDKSKTGTNYYYEARAEMNYKIDPAKVTSVGLSASKPSPQVAGTIINFKAESQGSPTPEYRFYVRDEKGNLTTLQEYGSSETTTWTPTAAGTYTIIVHAKDKNKSGANSYYEARTEMVYKVSPAKVTSVNLQTDKASPQLAGSTIIFKASSQGSPEPEYRFFIKDASGNLTTLQEYGIGDTTTWIPTKAGSYTIIVHAKDKSISGANYFYEARTEAVYKIE